MLVRPGYGAVDAHEPLHLAHRVRLGLRVRQEVVPGAVAPPAHEAVVAGLLGVVVLGQVAPRSAGSEFPQDTAHHRAVVPPAPAAAVASRQERRDLRRPGLVRQLAPLTIAPRLLIAVTGSRGQASMGATVRQTDSSQPSPSSVLAYSGLAAQSAVALSSLGTGS